MLKSILPTVNTDGDIGSDIRVKAERPKTLAVAWGSLPLDWVKGGIQSWILLFSVLAMERKAVIRVAPYGDWYGSHNMDGLGSLGEENADRMVFCYASSRSGLEVEAINPKGKVFRMSLAALPVVDTGV